MRTTLQTIVISLGMISAFTMLPAVVPASAEGAVITTQPTELGISTSSGNNCTNGEVIDGSTAAQAIAKFQAAGYTNVQILEKGCDNFWHATGVKGGQGGNIVLSPDGTVMPEGY
jgi:hypothetical protein